MVERESVAGEKGFVAARIEKMVRRNVLKNNRV